MLLEFFVTNVIFILMSKIKHECNLNQSQDWKLDSWSIYLLLLVLVLLLQATGKQPLRNDTMTSSNTTTDAVSNSNATKSDITSTPTSPISTKAPGTVTTMTTGTTRPSGKTTTTLTTKSGQGQIFTSVNLLVFSTCVLCALWQWAPSWGSQLEWQQHR